MTGLTKVPVAVLGYIWARVWVGKRRLRGLRGAEHLIVCNILDNDDGLLRKWVPVVQHHRLRRLQQLQAARGPLHNLHRDAGAPLRGGRAHAPRRVRHRGVRGREVDAPRPDPGLVHPQVPEGRAAPPRDLRRRAVHLHGGPVEVHRSGDRARDGVVLQERVALRQRQHRVHDGHVDGVEQQPVPGLLRPHAPGAALHADGGGVAHDAELRPALAPALPVQAHLEVRRVLGAGGERGLQALQHGLVHERDPRRRARVIAPALLRREELAAEVRRVHEAVPPHRHAPPRAEQAGGAHALDGGLRHPLHGDPVVREAAAAAEVHLQRLPLALRARRGRRGRGAPQDVGADEGGGGGGGEAEAAARAVEGGQALAAHGHDGAPLALGVVRRDGDDGEEVDLDDLQRPLHEHEPVHRPVRPHVQRLHDLRDALHGPGGAADGHVLELRGPRHLQRRHAPLEQGRGRVPGGGVGGDHPPFGDAHEPRPEGRVVQRQRGDQQRLALAVVGGRDGHGPGQARARHVHLHHVHRLVGGERGVHGVPGRRHPRDRGAVVAPVPVAAAQRGRTGPRRGAASGREEGRRGRPAPGGAGGAQRHLPVPVLLPPQHQRRPVPHLQKVDNVERGADVQDRGQGPGRQVEAADEALGRPGEGAVQRPECPGTRRDVRPPDGRLRHHRPRTGARRTGGAGRQPGLRRRGGEGLGRKRHCPVGMPVDGGTGQGTAGGRPALCVEIEARVGAGAGVGAGGEAYRRGGADVRCGVGGQRWRGPGRTARQHPQDGHSPLCRPKRRWVPVELVVIVDTRCGGVRHRGCAALQGRGSTEPGIDRPMASGG